MLLALAFLIPVSGLSQELPALPNDPRVRSGKLANGLSYILVKNAAVPGKADFCVAQKVGTSLESGGTLGSFRLLQELATRGTRNFEGNSLVEYLSRIGVEAENIRFSTGKDEITYLIKDVPVKRATTTDSSLLILYNWMSSINVDEGDLENERPILQNRMLYGWDAESRLNHRIVRELYPDSPYANTLMPDNLGRLDSLTSKELRSFYYNWCRPDLQCVIVAGDIDVSKLETQIKSIFSTIPKPLKPQERTYYRADLFSGIKAVLVKDGEYNKTTVAISLLKNPLKSAYRNTSLPYIQEYMDDAITRLLSDRINTGAALENIPLYNVSISHGKFLDMANTLAYTISFETLPNTVYAALSFISGEIDKMGRYGFSSQEFGRSIDIYWRQLENSYVTRESQDNSVYMGRALDNYYYGGTLASTEMKFELMKSILYSLNIRDLNSYAKALLGQDSSIVITCKMPDVEGITPLNKERILSSYKNSIGKSISKYQNLPVIEWPEVNPSSQASIVSDQKDLNSGSEIVVLSNGATVVFKNTTSSKDTISFRAISKGGFSMMKGMNIGNEEFFNRTLNLGGLGNLSEADLRKLFGYNYMNIEARLNQNTEELNGYAIEQNKEKLFQAIYLSFCRRRADKPVFEQYKKKAVYDVMYHAVSPLGIFQDSVNHYNNSNKLFVKALTAEQAGGYDYGRLMKDFRERFSNAADFVFVFAGKDVVQCKDLAVKYIGAIPSNPDVKENWVIIPNYLAKGVAGKRFLANMENPHTYVNLTLSCGQDLTLQNSIFAKMTEKYVESICRKKLHKYITNPDIEGRLAYYPENIFVLTTAFETDSASAEKMTELVVKELRACAEDKIPDAEFAALKEAVARSYGKDVNGNNYWLDILALKYITGTDLSAGTDDVIKSIDRRKFARFVKELLNGNRICVVMDGTTADIPTARMLQEDQFIRNYFNID